MSKFKVEFTLKQHTPIIHFQSVQSGATLRASELKPKFDRFLKKYAFDNKIPEEFRISDDKDAFNYKIKISSIDPKIIEFEKYPPLYFARDTKRKILSGTITITFMSFHSSLIDIIKSNFEKFLSNTNFGTRQSKGYGSFYIENKEFNKDLVTSDKTTVYSFDSDLQNWEKDIKLFYGFLRAGINEVDFKTKKSKFYAKSLMFVYAKSLGITWDKKAIKEHFLNHKTPQNYNLMKDLLGLSTNESWAFKEGGVKLGLTIQKESKNINRYKSPITFKPIQIENKRVRVYLFADHINKKFLDEYFEVKAKGTPLQIKTPKEFDIENFLKFSFSTDLSLHIDQKFQTHPNFKKLQNIFDNLKAQI